MAAPNVGELIATSMRWTDGKKTLADNMMDNIPFLDRLNRRGNVETFDGGYIIAEPLEYADNSTYKRFSGYEALNIQPSDVFDEARYDMKEIAVAVTMSNREILQNAGKARLIPLIEKRVTNAEKTLKNGIDGDLYSDGTSDGGKQIGGLQLLIDKTPATGTVGGINAANESWWRNQADLTSDPGTADAMQTAMNSMYANLVRNNEKPDLILADNTYYNLFLAGLQDIQRIQSNRDGNLGFTSIKYQMADVVLAGGVGGNIPSQTMYFCNSDYMHWRPHRDQNMTEIMTGDRYATNQAAAVRLLGFAGNLTTSNRMLHGVLAHN